MIDIKPYKIKIASAGANSGKGKYRRPVHVRVLDSRLSEWHALRGFNNGLVFISKNVDSRYSGKRSAYGRALIQAEDLANKLNKQVSDQISTCCII